MKETENCAPLAALSLAGLLLTLLLGGAIGLLHWLAPLL